MIVVDAGGTTERALWGVRMSKLALDRDVAGIVVVPLEQWDVVLDRAEEQA